MRLTNEQWKRLPKEIQTGVLSLMKRDNEEFGSERPNFQDVREAMVDLGMDDEGMTDEEVLEKLDSK